MAAQYSNQEWLDVVSRAQEWLLNRKPETSTHELPATRAELADYIDHTQLKLDATPADISRLCSEAITEKFHTVCVRENYVEQAVRELEGSTVQVACVVGFHEGTYSMEDKCDEAMRAIERSAAELDVVLNREPLQAKNYRSVYSELSAIRRIAPLPILLKLILETSQLQRDDIISASIIAGFAGFDFIKTSTGFNGRGASLDDVVLMSSCASYLHDNETDVKTNDGKRMKVKASGGIRTYDDAIKMIHAGASRLGTSGGLAIVNGTSSAPTMPGFLAIDMYEADNTY